MLPRLQHDASFALARRIVGIFENLILESEKGIAFTECYQACRSAFHDFVTVAEVEWQRLHPLEYTKDSK